MLKSTFTDRFTTVSRRLAVLLGIAALATTLAAPAANADRKQGSTQAKGCDVYNEVTGKTEQVPVGTKVGLFTCGSDGEWHFGWLVNAGRVSQPRPPRDVLTVTGASAVRLAKLAR